MAVTDHERSQVEARLRDGLERCDKGSVSLLPYLTPRQRKQAEGLLRELGRGSQAWFFGGYGEAERTCLFLLPEYMTDFLSAPIGECSLQEMREMLGEDLSRAVTAVLIRGSGYRELSHRDYLGSLLGLGLERDALGDIAVQDPFRAVVFCSDTIAQFLITSLTKVASDTVRCTRYEPDESFTDGITYRPIHDTVASPRLDCVVAALTNLSRENAQSAIRSGLVEVDFEPVERTDLQLTPPTVLSIRGHGRFILRSFDGETRKGRLRMFAEKRI
ncbi:MAG: hypothetical protein IJX62_03745 [Clostridia bacterium]|nr:hypothetical protein [Clostridia bacterium]